MCLLIRVNSKSVYYVYEMTSFAVQHPLDSLYIEVCTTLVWPKNNPNARSSLAHDDDENITSSFCKMMMMRLLIITRGSVFFIGLHLEAARKSFLLWARCTWRLVGCLTGPKAGLAVGQG